jgi:tetratricopeptide (TPR) repeat protein
MLAALLMALCFSQAGSVPGTPDEDPFFVSDEMAQFLSSKVDRGTESLQRLETLVRVIFQENELNFKYEPVTRTASETFRTRAGNCVSFTFMIIAMARHLGLDAHFREVEILPTWSKLGSLVTINGHVNVAVSIGGRGYVVDLFPRIGRLEIGGCVVPDGRALAHFYNNRGVDQLAAGNPEAAIEWFDQGLAQDPGATRVWVNRGVALIHLKRFREAENSYQQALKVGPKDLVAMSNLASLYERLGRPRDARRYMEKARKLQLKNPYFHYNKGLEAYQAGRYRDSIEHYRAALKLKRVEHSFHMSMARSYAQLGEMDKVEECLKLALKNAPDDASRTRYNEKLALVAASLH